MTITQFICLNLTFILYTEIYGILYKAACILSVSVDLFYYNVHVPIYIVSAL